MTDRAGMQIDINEKPLEERKKSVKFSPFQTISQPEDFHISGGME